MFKKLKPIFIENSSLPRWLSFFAPITIGAITLFPFVFSTEKMSEKTKNHEAIHFQQQLETFVFGFYLIYLWDYFLSRLSGLKGKESYYSIRAEIEAYDNDNDLSYLDNRKRWKWLAR